MRYRTATLFPVEAITADKTEPITIDIRDPISQIVITHEPVNGSQAHGDGHPASCITLIELVDGSDTLFSLSGKQAQAVDFFHNKRVPPNILCYCNGMSSEMIYILNFGRYLWDPDFALLPNRFKNLKLNISVDIDAGGALSSTGNLTVLAHVFDEKAVTPANFIMTKVIKQFTLANASHEQTFLPTDYMYRKLFVAAQRYGTGPEYQIDTCKLDEDTDKHVIFNLTMFQLIRAMQQWSPPYDEWIIGPGSTAANYFYCTPAYWPAFAAAAWRIASATGNVSIYEGDGGRFQEIQEAAGPNWQAHVKGWAPHGVVEIPFGLQGDPTDWFDVAAVGKLRLDIKGGASVGTSQTCEIFAQQIRPNPAA